MEIYKVSDNEFRTILLKKFSKLQEHKYRQLNKIRRIMYEQNKKLSKELETIKTNTQLEMLEMPK